jgi:5-dehydro-2-deoxygluconokinase
LDLVAIGRSSVDLYGQQVGGRLEDMASFAKYVGGSPTNTAIGLARLGLRPALLTRVGDDHMGRFIREQLTREGVDVASVRTDPDRLTALVILGIRDRDRFPLIFYREDCADMALDADDVDEAQIRSAAAVLINGTHLSTDTVFAASMKAARQAKGNGGRVVFDIDFRPVRWGLTDKAAGENRYVASPAVTARLQEVIALCDVIVGTEEEVHILGGKRDTIAALTSIRERTDALLICKLGPLGCVAMPGKIPADLSDGLIVPGFPVEVYNVLGAGDAFMAGFLSGWLRDQAIEQCCMLGNACGAIVVSRHGCAPAMPTKIELEAFLARTNQSPRLREDASFQHLHWATTRRGDYEELAALAVDLRSQFDYLARELDCDHAQIAKFKDLAFRALEKVAAGDSRFGILIDDRFGFDVLTSAAERSYWIGRPIEVPRSRPLEFEGASDVGLEIGTWPTTHVVKCLVFYHPDDPQELRERQERQLSRLFAACRGTGHELLLEIIGPAEMPLDDRSTVRAIERLYGVGVKPDWWKLEPMTNAAAWDAVTAAIGRNDPHCRGILLLGLSAPVEVLVQSFATAATFEMIKGFAVGRTVFHDVARQWLTGELDDSEAVQAMASRFAALVEGWRAARASVEAAA